MCLRRSKSIRVLYTAGAYRICLCKTASQFTTSPTPSAPGASSSRYTKPAWPERTVRRDESVSAVLNGSFGDVKSRQPQIIPEKPASSPVPKSTHYKKGAPLEYGLSALFKLLRKGAPFYDQR